MKTAVLTAIFTLSMQMFAQEVLIPFDQMIPTFRGMRLNLPAYPGEMVRECSFLISNKKNESFRLEIDKIWLETSL